VADKALYNLLIDLRADVASLQSDMNKAAQVVESSTGKMGSVVRGFFEGLGQSLARGLTQALTNPIQSIKSLDAALGKLADAGDKAGAVFDNFRALGGSTDAIQAAKRAVLGTVDSFDLMRAANEGMIKGIPKLNQNFAQLAEFSNRFADATGGETVPVLNELITALGSGAPKALRAFGFELQDGASKAENQAAVIAQLNQRLQELAPLGESVKQGQERLGVALAEAFKQVGLGVNESAALARVYNDLADAVDRIDWVQVGTDIASLASSIASLLPSIQTVTSELNLLALGFEKIAGSSSRAKIYELQGEAERLRTQLENQKATAASGSGGMGGVVGGWFEANAGANAAAISRTQSQLDDVLATIERIKDEAAFPMGGVGASQNLSVPTGMVFRNGRWVKRDDIQRPSAESVSDAARRKREEDDLQKKRLEHEQQLAAERSKQAAALMEAQYENQQRQIQDSTTQWSDALNVAFSELGVSPQVGRQMADLGGQIVAGLFSDLTEKQDGFFGLGQTIGQGFSELVSSVFGGSGSSGGGGGGSGGSWADGLGGLFGGSSGMSTDQAHAAGYQGPGASPDSGAAGSFNGGASTTNYAGYVQAGVGLFNDYRNRDDIDKEHQDNRGTGAAVGGTIGTVIGAIFGMPEVGQAIGSALGGFVGRFFGWGSQDADTISRHVFANWLEEKLEAVGGSPVYSDGSFRTLTNFVEGSRDRFNTPGWADELNKNPDAGVFTGLGEGLKELLGISEDIGGQLGALLFDNMEGSVNNLRMLMKRLGITFEDVEKALVEMGLRGEKTWLEIETAMQGASGAFADGLAEVGDFNLAMQMLLDSGAKGFEAVQNVRNIAIEAREAGVKNFEELRARMLETFDPATVDAFFRGLANRGIDNLEELANASDRVAGGVVADMQAAGVQFKDTGDQIEGATDAVNQSIKEATGAIRELAASVRGVKYEPEPEDEEELSDDGEPKAAFANGGVVFGPTRALMGEAGPEAVLPLSRKNGRMGVALHGVQGGFGNGGVVVNVDARGAAPGVEHRVMAALREMEVEIKDSLYRSIAHGRGRYT
jgi:hypothetical protein